MTQKYLNDLTYSIIAVAIEVHKELGPELLESIYEKCMIHLSREKGFKVAIKQKVPLPLTHSSGTVTDLSETS
jgi:GxxExxY protein